MIDLGLKKFKELSHNYYLLSHFDWAIGPGLKLNSYSALFIIPLWWLFSSLQFKVTSMRLEKSIYAFHPVSVFPFASWWCFIYLSVLELGHWTIYCLVTVLLSDLGLGCWAIQLHYYYLSGGLVVGPFSYTTKRASWAGPSHGSSWAGNVLLHSVEPNTVIVIKDNIKKYCPVFVISQMCWGEILFT